MEWLILCLLVPAVVVPVVLLWGFAGCNPVFGLEATVLKPTTTFELDSENNFDSPTATNQSAPTLEGSCFVVRIPKFMLSTGGSRVIITVRGSTELDLQIDRVYISQAADSVDASRDPYDPLGVPDRVVDDSAGVFVPKGERVTLKEVEYHLNADEDLLIAFDISASPGLANLRYVQFPGVTEPFTYYRLRVNSQDPPIKQAAEPDRTGFSPSVVRDNNGNIINVYLYLVEKIEVSTPN